MLEVCFGHPNNKIRRKKDKMNQNRYLYIGTLGKTEIGSCRDSTFGAQGIFYIHIICRFGYFYFYFYSSINGIIIIIIIIIVIIIIIIIIINTIILVNIWSVCIMCLKPLIIALKWLTCLSCSYWMYIPQLTFTCPNATIETLEKGVKYVQS